MDRSGQLYAFIVLGLCLVMVTYVVYRFATDGKKARNETAHKNYPLTSNPGDGMFPSKSDKVGWASYIFLSIAILLFLLDFVILLITDDFSILLTNLFGGFFIIGLVLQGISRSQKENA